MNRVRGRLGVWYVVVATVLAGLFASTLFAVQVNASSPGSYSSDVNPESGVSTMAAAYPGTGAGHRSRGRVEVYRSGTASPSRSNCWAGGRSAPSIYRGYGDGWRMPNEGVELFQTFPASNTNINYHLFTRGIDWSQPVGLVVRLHGDGFWEFSQPGQLVNCLASTAQKHNMVFLSVQSPDRVRYGENLTWWREIESNRTAVTELVSHIVEEIEPIDPQEIVWMGYSGGAEFLSHGLLHTDTELVSRAGIMVAGGGAPMQLHGQYLGWVPSARTPQYWIVGGQDNGRNWAHPFNARRATHRGADFYERAGFQRINRHIIPGSGHVGLPQSEILDRVLYETS